MALRGKKPAQIQKRLKALFYGPAGVGKTTAAIQFPAPYLIDTEKGAENEEYVEKLVASGGLYMGPSDGASDFDEVLKEVNVLLSEPHDRKTLIIDPLTVIYNDLIDKNVKRIAAKENVDEDDEKVTGFGRAKQSPDRKMKHLLTLLLRLDMNVIITSHAKMKWIKDGNKVAEDGLTFDCYNKIDYLFDLVFEITKRGKDKIVGRVKKTRCSGFPEGEVFPFCYDEIADRYGRDILERDSNVEELATSEQVSEIKRLVQLLKTPEETVDKWLSKAQADTFAEMPRAAIQACIEYLLKQVTTTAA